MLPRKATDWAFETQTCSSKQKQRRLCFALINLIGPQWLMDRKGQNKEMHSTKFIQKALHIAVYILPSVILIAFDQKKYCCASDLHWVNYAQRTIFLFFVTIHTKLVILIIFVISNARQCVILLSISPFFRDMIIIYSPSCVHSYMTCLLLSNTKGKMSYFFI